MSGRPSDSSSRTRVHFPDHLPGGSPESDHSYRTDPSYQHSLPQTSLPRSRFLSAAGATSDWQFPGDQSVTPPPSTYTNRPLSPNEDSVDDSRRASDSSTNTLVDDSLGPNPPTPSRNSHKSSLSSYNHPHDIQSPLATYSPHVGLRRDANDVGRDPSHKYDYAEQDEEYQQELEDAFDSTPQLSRTRRGYLSNLIDIYAAPHGGDHTAGVLDLARQDSVAEATSRTSKLVNPLAYNPEWEILDRDDPLVTGIRKRHVDDTDDLEKNVRRQMSYKERRKEQQRIRIEYNICSAEERQTFLMTFARALLAFGAPSHRMESQLLSAARILEVDAEFTHMPGLIIASFGDEQTKTSQMHFAKCSSRLSLGNLHHLHRIYRSVVHDELSAVQATEELNLMLQSGPMNPTAVRLLLSFLIAALICPIAFGGSFVDMFLAGAGSLFLGCVQTYIASGRSIIYANVYEILSVFCYSAISSSAVVTILPGYLILTSSLDLASKNILCGSIKMVYALIYTLFLGFGLQFGSDLFLLFDPSARHELDVLAARAAAAITITGTYVADANTFVPQKLARSGAFTFTPSTPTSNMRADIVMGCYRPPSFAWYLQPFPWWAQFVIVPVFSVLSSLNNEQPVAWDLVVMVVISCISYAANKVANHFIFNRSDVVSAIGAFVVGFLGNVYSRRMGGTAFTSMVTGVLFLVPSGLSEAGGITAQSSATQIGTAMVTVTIGITVGLFISQALVYLFGSRKQAAMFSF